MARPPTPVHSGYDRMSVALHWIVAVAMTVLYLTRGEPRLSVHASLGAVFGVVVIFRIWRRRRGFARPANEPVIFNLLGRLLLWGLLAAMLVVTITGYLLPWVEGRPYDVFGLVSVPPVGTYSVATAVAVARLHALAGDTLLVLVVAHVLYVLVHAGALLKRMAAPVDQGR